MSSYAKESTIILSKFASHNERTYPFLVLRMNGPRDSTHSALVILGSHRTDIFSHYTSIIVEIGVILLCEILRHVCSLLS